jgi:pimeloyl-ACP methyl ester carboxylesterase
MHNIPGCLHGTIEGNGFPVICLHGLAASLHDWDLLAPPLIADGYQILRPDLLGHGNSPKPFKSEYYTLDHAFSALIGWLDHTGILPPYNLIGHSLGGMLSLLFALYFPDRVNCLVLFSPFYSPNQISPAARWILHQQPTLGEMALTSAKPWLVYGLLGIVQPIMGSMPESARWQTAVDYARTYPASIRFPANAPDLTENLSKLKTPMLILWGKNDLTLNPRSFPIMIQKLPNAQGEEIQKCGHEPHLACASQATEIILRFMKANTHACQIDPA